MTRFHDFLTRGLLIVASLWLAPGCASRERPTPIFPPAVDLRIEVKPRLDSAAVDSEATLDAHDIALETWGERGWAAVARLCRYFESQGMGVQCAAPERKELPVR